MASKTIKIGLYSKVYEPAKKYRFEFIIGYDLPKNISEYNLVKTLHAPKKYEVVLALALNKQKIFHLGRIQYFGIGKGNVSSLDYFPKKNLRSNTQNSGLGAFLEMMAVHQLSKYGITNIQTSYGPSISRIKQLNKAGLEIRKQYSVRDWLKGIAKVVKVGKKPQINKPNLK